jgi:hypothetical protein
VYFPASDFEGEGGTTAVMLNNESQCCWLRTHVFTATDTKKTKPAVA